MTASDRALVVASAGDEHAGYVGERLEHRGLVLDRVLRDSGSIPRVAPADVPLVVLLGSAWSVVTPADHATLESECALVRSAVDAGTPVLAICYGAQVVAHALGGRVERASVPEIGLTEVESHDPSLVSRGPWWAFHTDVMTAPPAASVVARNACGVQAFTLPGVLGVQFHPEVVPAKLAEWLRRFPELVSAAGVAAEDLVRQAHDRERSSRAAAYALVDAFLARSPVSDEPTRQALPARRGARHDTETAEQRSSSATVVLGDRGEQAVRDGVPMP